MTSLALVGGAVAGSAAGAAMHRWPAGGTLARPGRSSCGACGRTLRWPELVPVISWVALGGRCRTCRSRIDARLPVLEVASAGLAVAIVRTHGPTPAAVLLALGAVAVLLAALIDLEHRIVPDRLTWPLAALAIVAAPLLAGPDRAAGAIAWAVGVPMALHLLVRTSGRLGRARPIGGGDVKLLVGVLALAGLVPSGPAAVLLVAVVGAGLYALLGLATRRLSRSSRIAFAPAIAAGFLTVTVVPDGGVAVLSLLGGHV